LSWLLAIALLVHASAHVAIAAGLARSPGPWWRGPIALVVPPLAPVWGWRGGMRARVYAWTGALALYALGVAVS
jgi:hypothetical protein